MEKLHLNLKNDLQKEFYQLLDVQLVLQSPSMLYLTCGTTLETGLTHTAFQVLTSE